MNDGESSGIVIGDVFSTATVKSESANHTLKCRISWCEKSWVRNEKWRSEIYHSHLISSHFKHLWAKDVPESRGHHADGEDYSCNVAGCVYKSKYRHCMLIHLAGKHKQFEGKLAEADINADILNPIISTVADIVEKQNESQVSSTTNDCISQLEKEDKQPNNRPISNNDTIIKVEHLEEESEVEELGLDDMQIRKLFSNKKRQTENALDDGQQEKDRVTPATDKSARKGVRLTSEQLSKLTKEFEDNRYPDRDKRKRLAKELGINEVRVEQWFRQRRYFLTKVKAIEYKGSSQVRVCDYLQGFRVK